MSSTTIPTHITSLPYGDNIALWNNRTGCHVVISKQSFEEGLENITPALRRRLNSMYMLDAALPQIELKIPHRNRNSLLVESRTVVSHPRRTSKWWVSLSMYSPTASTKRDAKVDEWATKYSTDLFHPEYFS